MHGSHSLQAKQQTPQTLAIISPPNTINHAARQLLKSHSFTFHCLDCFVLYDTDNTAYTTSQDGTVTENSIPPPLIETLIETCLITQMELMYGLFPIQEVINQNEQQNTNVWHLSSLHRDPVLSLCCLC